MNCGREIVLGKLKIRGFFDELNMRKRKREREREREVGRERENEGEKKFFSLS